MKALAVAVPVVAALATFIALGLPAPALQAISGAAYFLAALGSLAGAWSFAEGDRLRWAWLAIASGYGLGGLGVWFIGPPLHSANIPEASAAVALGVTTVMNLSLVGGSLFFVLAWRDLGLLPRWFVGAAAASATLGAVVAGPTLVQGVSQWSTSGVAAASLVISSLGDMAAITLAGPLAASALSMRGGALAWPYLFLAGQGLGWLLFDASVHLQGPTQVWADTFFSIVGMLYCGAAGYAHRAALRLKP